MQALKRMDYAEAMRRFEAAIELDARNTPAYLNLGDVRFLQGDATGSDGDLGTAHRHLARARLSGFSAARGGLSETGDAKRFPDLCRRLIAENPQDWRARLALARHLSARGEPRAALDLLFEALVHNPHALALHQTIWHTLSQLELPP